MKPAIEVGRVYCPKPSIVNPRSSHRRVIDIIAGKLVCYSDGGDRNKFCSVGAFRRAVVLKGE